MTIDIGAELELDLTGKHDKPKEHVLPKPIRKPVGVAINTGASPAAVIQLLLDQYPANGRTWEIIQVGVFGSDGHSDLNQAVGNPVVLAASGTASYNNNPYPVNVAVNGGTVTQVAVNGTVAGSGDGTYYVPAGGTITVTYSVAPTLVTTGVTGPAGVLASPLLAVVADVYVAQSADANFIDFSAARISGMNVGSIENLGHKKVWVHPQEQTYALVYGAPANQNLSFVIMVDEWRMADIEATEIRS
jgi:hypothetical protein